MKIMRLLLCALFAASAIATHAMPNRDAGTITVVGEGIVRITPDIATVKIGVEALAPAIEDALGNNRDTIEAVYEALISLGIHEDDLQTSNYSFNFERSSQSAIGSSRSLQSSRTLYRVNNVLTVTIRDLEMTADIIDAAVFAGANQMWGVDFDVEDSDAVYKRATELAVRDAEKRVRHLAELTGVEVGELLEISETVGTGLNAITRTDSMLDYSPGLITFNVQIEAQYRLLHPKTR